MKTIKAYVVSATVILILTIAGIVVSVSGVAAGTYIFCKNWESHEEITVSFNVNEDSKTTSYYACESDSLSIYQEEGNSDCAYGIYYKSRTQRNYDEIEPYLTFSENDSATAPYTLESHWWDDVRFMVKKADGTSVKSAIVMSLGQIND